MYISGAGVFLLCIYNVVQNLEHLHFFLCVSFNRVWRISTTANTTKVFLFTIFKLILRSYFHFRSIPMHKTTAHQIVNVCTYVYK